MHKNVWAYINPFVILPHKMMSNTDHMYVCILDKCFITWNKWMLCEKSSRVKCRLGIIMCHYDYIEPYFKSISSNGFQNNKLQFILKNKFYQSFASWRLYFSNVLRKLGQKQFNMPIFKKAIMIFLSLFLPKSEIKQINTMDTQITISLKHSKKKN